MLPREEPEVEEVDDLADEDVIVLEEPEVEEVEDAIIVDDDDAGAEV